MLFSSKTYTAMPTTFTEEHGMLFDVGVSKFADDLKYHNLAMFEDLFCR